MPRKGDRMSYTRATIVREPHAGNYTCIDNATLQDRDLSWEARGILAYILSKPDGWKVQIKDLEQGCKKGRVYRILDELKAAGYLEDRTKFRDDKGRWQYTPYVLHERPITGAETADKSLSETPYPEKPDTDEPDTDEPDTENADVLVSKDRESKEKDSVATATQPAVAVVEKEKPDPISDSQEEKRNRLFDGVARLSFGIEDTTTETARITLKAAGGRIGKIVTFLKKVNCTPEKLWQFYRAYQKQYPDIDPPRDIAKFALHYEKFIQGRFDKQGNPPVSNRPELQRVVPLPDISDEDHAAALKALQEFRPPFRKGKNRDLPATG